MNYADNDTTVALFQREPGSPLEIMPPPDISRTIAMRGLELTSMGINPLIDQFSWLIACLSCLPSIPALDDTALFREQVVREVRKGERKLNEMKVERATILVVRYCLCAAIDEAILSQQWGADSHWSQHSLLTEFHNETAGGDKFFVILERLKVDPRKYRYVIEFLYLLLQMGFKGKYGRDLKGGQAPLLDIGHVVYRLIRDVRLAEQEKLSLVNLKVKYLKQPLTKVISPKATAIFTVTMLSIMYFGASLWIKNNYQQLLSLYL